MRSFQDWLDCQLYTSHLKNLTKIREDTICLKASNTNRRQLKTSAHTRSVCRLDTPERQAESRIRMFNPKSTLKENRIKEQNYNLASRLINVSSVISKDKQLQEYRKYQSLFKKNASVRKFDNVKARKLQRFLKVSEDKCIAGIHKSIVRIKFICMPKIPEGQSTTIWVEVYSGMEKAVSTYYSSSQILEEEIKIPLRKKADKNLVLLVHCSRGLDYISLGEYYLEAGKDDPEPRFLDLVSFHDQRKRIKIRVEIEELTLVRKHKTFHANQ